MVNGESVTSDEIDVVTLREEVDGEANDGAAVTAEPPKNNVAESTLLSWARRYNGGLDGCRPEARRLGIGEPLSDEEEDGDAWSRNWEAPVGNVTALRPL